MKTNTLNKMDQEEMVARYMASRPGEMDWKMPASGKKIEEGSLFGQVQKAILTRCGVLA